MLPKTAGNRAFGLCKARVAFFALALAVAACGGTDGNEGNADNGGGAAGAAGTSPDGGLGNTGGASGAAGTTAGAGGADASSTGGSAGVGGSAGAGGSAGTGGMNIAEAGAEVDAGGPACGNGIREGNEECDDGNTLDQDGCSSTCMLTRCCESCEDNNCPVDNTRDPVSGKLVSQPTCAAFADDKTAGGKLKRELCAAVQACIVRTACALDDATACYCGKGVTTDQCKTVGPTGPCVKEIQDGLESTDVDVVLGHLVDVTEASGAALNRAACDYLFCTTPGAGHTHTPGACYRSAGTPIPACDVPPEAGVDTGTSPDVSADTGATADSGAGSPDVSTDSGSTADAPHETSVADAQTDGEGGTCHESTTCAACETSNCPNDPTGCSNGTCVVQPACGDFLTQPQRDACAAVQTCVRTTNCTAGGPLSCYCGTADATQCNSTTPPNANGVCKAVIETGFGSTSPSLIRGNLLVVSYPAGAALSIAQCDHDFCGNDSANECVPYCK